MTSDEKVASGLRKGARGPWSGADPGQLRRRRQCRQDRWRAIRRPRPRELYPMQQFELAIQINLIGTFRCIANAAFGMVDLEPLERRRAGRASSTQPRSPPRTARSARRPIPPQRAACLAMALPIARDLMGDGDQGQHHPSGRVQDADGRDDAAKRAGSAGRAGAVSRSGSARPKNMPGLPASSSRMCT